ncbi:hypothetical protein GCM10011594_38620 [Nakamurella endophytica]|uniref:Uncharacterized protein n=1 Tax=Nakamurella endophytica TaxID=1748367 RepID=A0A917WMQ7_9ACTN|nr:hypothetical protein GCM10011594_38620 [Nakamurella endophytica]
MAGAGPTDPLPAEPLAPPDDAEPLPEEPAAEEPAAAVSVALPAALDDDDEDEDEDDEALSVAGFEQATVTAARHARAAAAPALRCGDT